MSLWRLIPLPSSFHDLVAYPVFAGGLLFGLVPVLAYGESRIYGWFALIGLALWGGGGIADITFHKLDPRYLHQMYDWG